MIGAGVKAGDHIYAYLTERSIPDAGVPDTNEEWLRAETRHVNRAFKALVLDQSIVSFQLQVLDKDVIARMGGKNIIWIERNNVFHTAQEAQNALLGMLEYRVKSARQELDKRAETYEDAASNPPQ
jgi:hypothetical protein